jgi:hypothetical protein
LQVFIEHSDNVFVGPGGWFTHQVLDVDQVKRAVLSRPGYGHDPLVAPSAPGSLDGGHHTPPAGLIDNTTTSGV